MASWSPMENDVKQENAVISVISFDFPLLAKWFSGGGFSQPLLLQGEFSSLSCPLPVPRSTAALRAGYWVRALPSVLIRPCHLVWPVGADLHTCRLLAVKEPSLSGVQMGPAVIYFNRATVWPCGKGRNCGMWAPPQFQVLHAAPCVRHTSPLLSISIANSQLGEQPWKPFQGHGKGGALERI